MTTKVWYATKRRIKVSDMEDDHVLNAMRYCERYPRLMRNQGPYRACYQDLLEEAERRQIIDKKDLISEYNSNETWKYEGFVGRTFKFPARTAHTNKIIVGDDARPAEKCDFPYGVSHEIHATMISALDGFLFLTIRGGHLDKGVLFEFIKPIGKDTPDTESRIVTCNNFFREYVDQYTRVYDKDSALRAFCRNLIKIHRERREIHPDIKDRIINGFVRMNVAGLLPSHLR